MSLPQAVELPSQQQSQFLHYETCLACSFRCPGIQSLVQPRLVAADVPVAAIICLRDAQT